MRFKDFVEKRNSMEKNDLCMFFKKDGSIYGATESGRIAYATIKNPESKEDLTWTKDASVILYDLEKESEDKRIMVSSSDIGDFKPISQDQAENVLKKKGKKIPLIKDDDEEEDGDYYGEE